MNVSVSILNEKNNYIDVVKKINNTNADYLHLDIMDGSFTDNISFDIKDSMNISNLSNKKLDVHIMSNKLSIIDDYININPYNITFHIENQNINEYIDKIKQKNIKVGLAINPNTNIEKIFKYLNKIDIILVMSVEPGKGGQKFIEKTIKKIKVLKKLQNNYKYKIEVDGGINDYSIKLVKKYVDIVVAGSFITNSNNFQKSIDILK